jgi:hypothetical protein
MKPVQMRCDIDIIIIIIIIIINYFQYDFLMDQDLRIDRSKNTISGVYLHYLIGSYKA